MQLLFPQNDNDAVFEQKMLEYREQFAERKQITDRSVQLGDALIIDFKGFIDGAAFQGGEAKGHAISKLGSDNLIPGFEDQIVGMSIGDTKPIIVTFPQNYGVSAVAGKEARFETTLHSIVETKLADVNDDLALMVGYQSVEELNKHIRDGAEDHINYLNKKLLEEQIIQKLLEANKFDVPLSMVDSEKSRILKSVGNNKVQPDMVNAMATRNVKRAVILDAIYEKEPSLEVTPAELDKLLEQHAKMYGKTKDEIVSMLYSTHQMDAFLGTLRAQRAVEFIIEKAKQNKEREERNGRQEEQASGDGV
jgi:trigger factor